MSRLLHAASPGIEAFVAPCRCSFHMLTEGAGVSMAINPSAETLRAGAGSVETTKDPVFHVTTGLVKYLTLCLHNDLDCLRNGCEDHFARFA